MKLYLIYLYFLLFPWHFEGNFFLIYNINDMKKIFIGIDFSLSSPAICIISSTIKLISLLKIDSDIDKAYKTPLFKELVLLKELSFVLHPKDNVSKENYSKQEREKIINYVKYSDLLIELIKKELDINEYDELYIGMEGISFGSTGNTLIDISMATSILRSKIIEISGPQNFHVFSPSTIKKFAGKGNYKKIDMYNSLIESVDIKSEFIELLKRRKDLFITPKGVVKKPAEDLIDSIWTAKLLKHIIDNDARWDISDKKHNK